MIPICACPVYDRGEPLLFPDIHELIARIKKIGIPKVKMTTNAYMLKYKAAALKKAGLSMKDLDVIELNEAFASQALACIRAWGLADDDPRLNPNGGAIAIGHPLGVTGARVAYSAALELKETGKRYALITMCVGVGQGYAAVIERV